MNEEKLQSRDTVREEGPQASKPLYRIDEKPGSWPESLLYGWQHTLVDISPFILPLAVAAAAGMGASDQARFINFCLLSMGVATLIQTSIGNRLPIVQGPSATLTGTLAPVAAQMGAASMWGAVFVGALFESLVGALRLPGRLKRFFPPLVSGIVIVSIGFALGQLAVRLAIGDGSGRNFLYAGGVIVSIFTLQIVFARLARGLVSRGAIFFSIWILGLGIALPAGDVDWRLVAEKPWFQLPTLFPFGGPGFGWEFAWPAILAVVAGYLGSMVESIGDYAATCNVAGEDFKARHMNRGILAEGLGCLSASALGGLPCTSYTQNIGIIATTRVASRHVVRIAALILILYGLCPKFGALLVALPRSILGGVFVIVCGTIVLSGFRLLSASRTGPAERLLAGTSLIVAVTVPLHVNLALGQAWLDRLPVLLRLTLTNSVVLAVILAVGLHALFSVAGARREQSDLD